MKKLHTLSLAILLVFTVTARAQVNKGALLVGGSLSGFSQHDYPTGGSDFTQKGLTISPSVGIAVRQNLVIGFNPNYSWVRNRIEDAPEQFSKSYSLGGSFFLRKYKTLGKSGFSAFLQGDLGASHGKDENNNGVDEFQTKRFAIGLSAYPGISFAISRRLQLETGFNNLLSISWSKQKSEKKVGGTWADDGEAKRLSINTSLNNFNSSLYLGFRVLLNKV